MQLLLVALLLFSSSPLLADSKTKSCSCKCVTKEEEKYVNTHGSGADREAAGNDLKKNLGKKSAS